MFGIKFLCEMCKKPYRLKDTHGMIGRPRLCILCEAKGLDDLSENDMPSQIRVRQSIEDYMMNDDNKEIMIKELNKIKGVKE